jgi:hypothetical protein
MRFSILKSFLLIALAASFLHAQEPAPATMQPPKSAAAPDSQATVYVYRYKQFQGSALSPSVYCDETELARMDNGRFFVVKLAPGKHVFRSNDKQSGIDADLKPGQDYYIRVEIVAGMMKGHGRLVSVASEQGSYEIKSLKALGSDKVKDTQHVVPVSLQQ